MTTITELHIVAPGVCGPLAETRTLENNTQLKKWVRVLSQAHCVKPSTSSVPTSVNDVVTSLFKLSVEGDFPSAALTMLALDQYDETESYMFADPVHLQADLDHAVLTSSQDLAIGELEAKQFCEMLNQHFNQDGFKFITLNNNQWVITSKAKIKISTTPLAEAIGRNVNFILPKGDGSGNWKQKLTEAQMLMHSHEINTIRENTGQQSINSLWLYGSGSLPVFDYGVIKSVCSDDVLFEGLASHVQCDYQSLFKSAVDYMSYLTEARDERNSTSNVLHLSALEHLVNYSDVSIWSGRLEEMLDSWIYPLLKIANKNNIKVTLYPCNGCQYQFSKYDSYKFWRQATLEQFVSSY